MQGETQMMLHVNHVLTFLLFQDENLSWRVPSFVPERHAAASLHIPVGRGGVSRGGMWSFKKEMTEDTGGKQYTGFSAKSTQHSTECLV